MKLQRAIDNQKSIPEAENLVEPKPSLFRSFRSKKIPVLSCAICNEQDLLENLQAANYYYAKRKVVNAEHNKNITEKWKEMALNSDNPNLLALIFTEDLAAKEIFYHASCYKSMQYKWNKSKRDRSSTDWKAEQKKAEAFGLWPCSKLHNRTLRIQSWFCIRC